MEARLMAGGSGYDVVSASTDFFSREIRAGVYMPLDKSKLTNWKNLDPRILAVQAAYDPGNAHGRAYLHSINGFAYNVDMVKARMPNAPVDSPRHALRSGGDLQVRRLRRHLPRLGRDVLQLALQYLKLDPNTTRREDFAAAEAMLLKVRPYIRSFDSTEFMNGLANREVCVAMSWSSDYALSMSRARAVGVELKLAFNRAEGGRQSDIHLATHSRGGAATPRRPTNS